MGCGLGSYTFGHEISHNIGNDHDKHDRAGGHKVGLVDWEGNKGDAVNAILNT